MSRVSPGVSHVCLKSTLISNAQTMLKHCQALDTFVGDNVLQRTNQFSHKISSIQIPTTSGGYPLNITVSSSTDERPAKCPKMDFSHIASLKTSGASMSNKQLKVVTQIIRKVGVSCPSMDSYYRERHLLCDELFECVQIELDYSKEKYSSDFRNTWIVRCHNIDYLVEKMLNITGEVSVHDLHFKLGLDFGRGFTKLLLCPQHDSSVNNQVYLLVTSAPECNYNFSIMLRDEQIKRLIENYNISFTVDLKAASYCLGLMLGRHPCIWCTWDKRSGLSSVEWKPRSSSHHLEMFTKLCDKYQGYSKNNAIDCDGIEDSEVFDVWLVDYMQMFNLPELHLLLGIGQKLYDSILCTMSEEEKEFHEALLRKHNIQKSTYHGGAFEGNAMRKITKQATDLGFPKNNSSYITLLRFSAVVITCFGKEITGDYKMA